MDKDDQSLVRFAVAVCEILASELVAEKSFADRLVQLHQLKARLEGCGDPLTKLIVENPSGFRHWLQQQSAETVAFALADMLRVRVPSEQRSFDPEEYRGELNEIKVEILDRIFKGFLGTMMAEDN